MRFFFKKHALILLLIGSSFSFLTAQTTHTVCSSGCDFTTITAAIAGATSGDIISITDAVHTEQGITVSKNLTINGISSSGSIIQAHAIAGSATDRVFTINAGVTVVMNDLTIRHGNPSDNGGGIYNQGTLTQTNCTISDNSTTGQSSNGGGIYNAYNRHITQYNCTISGNTSGSGAGIYNYGTLIQTNCTIANNIGNTNSSNGGGIYTSSGTLYQTNCTVAGNSASFDGGIHTHEGYAYLKNTIIANNTAYNYNDNLSGSLVENNNNICEGCSGTWVSTADPMLGTLADNGGKTKTIAITSGSSPAVNSGGFEGNNVFTDQRGYFKVGTKDIGAFEYGASAPANYTVCGTGCDYTTIANAIFNANNADTISITDAVHTEQGILVNKNLTINGTHPSGTIIQAHVTAGSATDRVFTISAGVTVVMNDLTIRHGKTSSEGGGIRNEGTLTMMGCTISGNSVSNTFGSANGGGIYNHAGSLTLTNCTISGNSISSSSEYVQGGGILNSDGTLTITGCTISGNTIEANGDNFAFSTGGGIGNLNSVLIITNSTISNNNVNHIKTGSNSYGILLGGGIYNVAGSLTIMNATISENSTQSFLGDNSSYEAFGGGIYNENGTFTMTNTIIANNNSEEDPNLFDSNPENIINNNNICEDCSGTWTSTDDPMLGTLADNGGSTPTIAITDYCSPAVDAGTSTGAPTLDQAGQARFGTIDIGAFENQGPTETIGGTPRPGAGYTLDFEEDNIQSVMVPYDASLDLGNTFSFEAWVNLESYTTQIGPIISMPASATGSGVRFGIRSNGGIDFLTNAGGILTSAGSIDLAKWVHLTGTYDGTNFKLYKNGVLLATEAVTYSTSAFTQPLFIGVEGSSGIIADRLFDGKIDEVRIWDSALSETEIKDWMCKKITADHPDFCDLVAYYRFDENMGTTLTDLVGENDGTLINAPTWEISGAALGDESSHDYNGNTTTVSQSHTDGSFFKIDNLTGTPDGAHIYLVNESPNTNNNTLTGDLEETRYYGTFIVGGTTPKYTATYDYSNNTNLEGDSNEAESKFAKRDNNASTNWNTGSGDFDLDKIRNEISVCNESGNSEYIAGFHTSTIVERPGSGYALNFDGTNQYLDLPDGLTSTFNDFTFETWFYTDANVSWARLIDFGSSTAVNMFLTPSFSGSNIPRFAITVSGNGASEQRISAPTALANNQWYHIAITIDDASNTGSMYINGVLVAQNTSMTLRPSDLGNTTNNYLGKSQYNDPYLNGKMDEVRIWDKALSESEIRDWMCKKVTAGHPDYCDLVAYYRFDENTGNTLTDVVNGNNGNLINAPTYEMSSVPAGDESVSSYNVTNSTSINLTHTNGDKMTVNVTNAGGADAIQLYRVDEESNVNTPPAGLEEISQFNHWGVKTFGGAGTVYEVVYSYDGHPGINVESELRLLSRASNATMSWTEETTAILDESNNTLTLGGQTGTQFVLGSKSSNSLPIELIYFHAYAAGENAQLKWSTASEINNRGFDIQHSLDGVSWEKIGYVAGNENTTTISNYDFVHKKPAIGINYYRLKQFDLDGNFELLPIKTVDFKSDENGVIQVFPNPVKEFLNITNTKGVGKIYNISGQLMMEVNLTEEGINSVDVSRLGKGVFHIVLIKNNGQRVVKRFMK